MPQWLDDYIKDKRTTCSFQASGFDVSRFEFFCDVLRAYGLEVVCEVSSTGKSANVAVHGLPETLTEAKERGTRNAGRKLRVTLPKSSVFNSGTTCTQFLEYIETHKVADTMEQLGITSRSKYYRVLDIIKAQDNINGSLPMFQTSIRFL